MIPEQAHAPHFGLLCLTSIIYWVCD